MKCSGGLALGTIFAIGALAVPAANGQISFQRLIGTGDALPGAPPGTTINYPFEAQAAGEWVAFGAFSQIGTGVYAWDGTSFHLVVDELTPVPGGQPAIRPIPDVGMDVDASGRVVTYAETSTSHGVWRWRIGEPIELVIQTGSPSPTAPGETVLAADLPRVWGETTYVVVERSGASRLEIIGFASGGLPFAAIPSHLEFTYSAFDVAAAQLLYRARDTDSLDGLWRAEPGDLPELLLTSGAPLSDGFPGETWLGPGTSLLRVGLGGAVFNGAGSLGSQGFFASTQPGAVQALVRHGDPEPRTGLPILQLPSNTASASEHRFAFIAILADGSRHLSVREPDGSFLPIISTGDVLEGQVVNNIWISTKAFANDNRLVAEIHRQGDGAIWIIDLPPVLGPAPTAIPTSSPFALAAFSLILVLGGMSVLGRNPSP